MHTQAKSPAMLVDAGVKYVVLGHSERREYFGETNEDVNKKVLKAFEHGITPIMCCGETLTQREQGVTMDFIRQQVKLDSRVLQQIRLKQQLSLTSQSGQSEQVKQLQLSRLRRFAQVFVHASLKSMMKQQQQNPYPVWRICKILQQHLTYSFRTISMAAL